MNINDIKKIIAENFVRLELIRINDNFLIPGGYYLYYDEITGSWKVFLNDKADFQKRNFDTENEACHYFLDLLFSDPTVFKDFSMKDYKKLVERGKELKKKYLH